jgi:nicotinamide mononucleotide transporter
MSEQLEIAANGTAALSIFLSGRNNIHSWWIGIVACLLFGVLFYRANLYADVMLQLFFIATGFVGWWNWVKGDQGHGLAITHANFASLAWTVPVGLLATAAYGAMLHFYTNAYAPFLDSAVLVFSIIGQILLMQRRIENWAFWLLVNAIGVPVYASRGLYLTAALFAAYFFNALVSWWWWHKLASRHTPPATVLAGSQ